MAVRDRPEIVQRRYHHQVDAGVKQEGEHGQEHASVHRQHDSPVLHGPVGEPHHVQVLVRHEGPDQVEDEGGVGCEVEDEAVHAAAGGRRRGVLGHLSRSSLPTSAARTG